MELIGSLNCGSMIVEQALALTGLPHTVTDIPYLREGPERDRLLSLNPLGQVPTLVLGDGTVMTESAAIVLCLNDVVPAAGLLPPPGAAARAAYLNQLIRLVAAIYPTFTYGDDPGRWTIAGDAAHTLRLRTNLHREALFRSWEEDFGPGPFAAGEAVSALDLYLVAMTHWRPGHAWFAANAPHLLAAADAAAAHPKLAPIAARHRAGPAEAA
jgi:GST-like protein